MHLRALQYSITKSNVEFSGICHLGNTSVSLCSLILQKFLYAMDIICEYNRLSANISQCSIPMSMQLS